MSVRLPLVMVILGGSASALSAQSGVRFTPMAHGVAAATRADPTPTREAITEVRVVQPTLMGEASALGGRAGRFAAGKLLVGAQVALSLVLLAGAALLVRSLRSVEQGPTGASPSIVMRCMTRREW